MQTLLTKHTVTPEMYKIGALSPTIAVSQKPGDLTPAGTRNGNASSTHLDKTKTLSTRLVPTARRIAGASLSLSAIN